MRFSNFKFIQKSALLCRLNDVELVFHLVKLCPVKGCRIVLFFSMFKNRNQSYYGKMIQTDLPRINS